ncbi:hypothetical protein Tco_0501548, partial [Tanacetum coccineum]
PKPKEKMLGESTVAKIPLKFMIKKRKQPDLETSFPTAEQIDLENLTEV